MSCFCRKLADPLIRPPRSRYSVEDLGDKLFKIGQLLCLREDFSVLNRNGLRLAGSLFRPQKLNTEMACVVYLHGNIGSRLSSLTLVEAVLTRGMPLVCFDFAGCGHSEGDYISLGYNEHYDVHAVLEYLKGWKNIKKFVLWGRSMGAVAAVRYQQEFKEGIGLVLDSPYSNFRKMANELAERKFFLLGLLVGPLLGLVTFGTEQRMNLDLREFNPVEFASSIHCPVFFIASEDDQIVHPDHVRAYYERCASNRKTMKLLRGGHNQGRTPSLISQILQWVFDDQEAIHTESTVAQIRCSLPHTAGRNSSFMQSTFDSFLA